MLNKPLLFCSYFPGRNEVRIFPLPFEWGQVHYFKVVAPLLLVFAEI